VADRRALVIDSPGSIALRDAPELVPGPGEVVARPAHVGICGTDLELLAGVVDPAYVRYPLVPGHEWSGVIEAVGPGVANLEPGQRVIAEGIIPDRVCEQCVRGNQARAAGHHRFPLDAYEEAYQVLRESSGPRGKVMLDVNGETR
jgi:threonine dehydrogenase-like Zn-dependent dehydrogenase